MHYDIDMSPRAEHDGMNMKCPLKAHVLVTWWPPNGFWEIIGT